MKQRDITLFVMVGIVSLVASALFSNLVIRSPKNRSAQVEVVEPISSEFTEPDSKYFNEDSINPTQIIQIQDNKNQKPFSEE